jgi:hypothetical protein
MSISSLEDFEVYFDYFLVTGIPPVNTGPPDGLTTPVVWQGRRDAAVGYVYT